jgi:hypothetical protein
MEPEESLLHSQVPANCPYPEPDRSSPYPHIPLPEDPSEYYPPIYAWVSKWSLSLALEYMNVILLHSIVIKLHSYIKVYLLVILKRL